MWKKQNTQNKSFKLLQELIQLKINKIQNEMDCDSDLPSELITSLLALDRGILTKNFQQILKIRLEQFALAKLLVFCHFKHSFRLVTAHTKLGEAFLINNCIQPSLSHLLVGLHLNEKLIDQIPQCQLYNSHIKSLLGRNYVKQGQYLRAKQLFMSSLRNINEKKEILNIEISCAEIYILIADCYTMLGDYAESKRCINQVHFLSQAQAQELTSQKAEAYVKLANIYALEGDFQQAQKNQNKAIDFLIQINFKDPKVVAQLFMGLGNYQQKNRDMDGYVDSLKKVKTIYQQIHQKEKVIEIKKTLANIYNKTEKFNLALSQLMEICQLEQKISGQNSVPVAKINLAIADICMTAHKFIQATSHFKRALKIFDDFGFKKQAQQIIRTLELIKKGTLNKIQ